VSFVDAIKSGFRNYVTFKGRASRAEFWWWTLFAVLVQGVTSALGDAINGIASLVLLIPGLSVNVRRLHDTNRRGTWLLWPLMSLVVALVSFAMFAATSDIDWSKVEELDAETVFDGTPVVFLVIGGIALVATLVLGIINFAFTVLKSDPQMNRFGPPPPPKSLPTK
jgi:uncharacterized membrane protein YhaH (DUF805 family)